MALQVVALPLAFAAFASAAVAYVAERPLWFVVGVLGAIAGYLLFGSICEIRLARYGAWGPDLEVWRAALSHVRLVAATGAWIMPFAALAALGLPAATVLVERWRRGTPESQCSQH
jgi:hypothetical protein